MTTSLTLGLILLGGLVAFIVLAAVLHAKERRIQPDDASPAYTWVGIPDSGSIGCDGGSSGGDCS